MRVSVSGAGKGSGRRPTLVDTSVAHNNWERVFGKKEGTPSNKLYLYKFCDFSMDTDEVDEKTGRVKKYQEVNVVASSLENARIKGKLGTEYTFVNEEPLGKDWR